MSYAEPMATLRVRRYVKSAGAECGAGRYIRQAREPGSHME